jgi:acyl-CoA reductase-like NAD-dependent aldehyde dehydrogenase
MRQCLAVIQNTEVDLSRQGWNEVLESPSKLRIAAIVDRSANVDDAARDIACLKFSRHGRSSFAPDIVYVNEFVANEFLSRLVSHVAGPMSRDCEPMKYPTQRLAQKLLKEFEESADMRIVVTVVNTSVIEVYDR